MVRAKKPGAGISGAALPPLSEVAMQRATIRLPAACGKPPEAQGCGDRRLMARSSGKGPLFWHILADFDGLWTNRAAADQEDGRAKFRWFFRKRILPELRARFAEAPILQDLVICDW